MNDDSLPDPQPSSRGKHLGWILAVALLFAVSVAISLAVQLDPSPRSTPPYTPPCGGLYDECCQDWEDDWGPCVVPCRRDHGDDLERDDSGRYGPQDGGLFDAEENFAERRLPARC